MYAVIMSGGKQYRVTEGCTLKLEKLTADIGSKFNFDRVLMVANGENVQIGNPYLSSGKVSAEIISHGRGKKVTIIKMRRRKHYRKQMGHRQDYTEVKIQSIKGA